MQWAAIQVKLVICGELSFIRMKKTKAAPTFCIIISILVFASKWNNNSVSSYTNYDSSITIGCIGN